MNTKLNKSDFILLSIYFIVSFIMQARDYYLREALLREYRIDFPIEIFMISSIVFLYIFWLIPKLMINKQYFLFTLFGVFILVFFSGIDYVVGYWSGNNDWSKFPKPADFFFKMIDRATYSTAFPFALLLTKKFYEWQSQILRIEKQQKENELKLLRSQIDPHFLFNNLNTLDSLIDSDSEKAKEYINRLSLIYRYLIQTKDAEVMELRSEIQFAENYIFLIETRFGNDYKFTIEKEGDITDKFIPTGALQALLENVVKHNKASNKVIKTQIKITNDWLTVNNTKSNTLNKESLGTGLQNLQTRYELLSDKKVDIKNANSRFVISIPIIKLSEEN